MAEHTVTSLTEAIRNIDALSEGALTKIEAIARLAMHALEVPSGVRDLKSLGYAFQAIAEEANQLHNDIGVEAEGALPESGSSVGMRRFSVACAVLRSIEDKAVAKAMAGRA